MREPSLRFRFFTETTTASDVVPSPSTEQAPVSSRRNRLTARQEWLEAELESSMSPRRVDAA